MLTLKYALTNLPSWTDVPTLKKNIYKKLILHLANEPNFYLLSITAIQNFPALMLHSLYCQKGRCHFRIFRPLHALWVLDNKCNNLFWIKPFKCTLPGNHWRAKIIIFFIFVLCILITLKLLSPINAPLNYSYKMLKYTARLSPYCSYMFRWAVWDSPLSL